MKYFLLAIFVLLNITRTTVSSSTHINFVHITLKMTGAYAVDAKYTCDYPRNNNVCHKRHIMAGMTKTFDIFKGTDVFVRVSTRLPVKDFVFRNLTKATYIKCTGSLFLENCFEQDFA